MVPGLNTLQKRELPCSHRESNQIPRLSSPCPVSTLPSYQDCLRNSSNQPVSIIRARLICFMNFITQGLFVGLPLSLPHDPQLTANSTTPFPFSYDSLLLFVWLVGWFSWRYNPLWLHFPQPGNGFSLLVFRGFLITHNDSPQPVGLLWTSDQSVAETST